MLSNRQRDELNRAVADYLKQSGYSGAYAAFKEESNVQGEEDSKYNNILTKKWISIVRLQKKILDLQSQLTDVKDEVKEVTTLEGLQRRKDPTQWMPRAPADNILSSHRSPVTCVIFHPSFPVMVSGSEDATIKLWDYETGEYERTLKGHTDTVNSIDFEPSKGKYLASSSADMTIKIWDFTSTDFDCLKTLKGHDHNVSSVRFINSDSIVSASRDRTIKIWQVESGFCTKTLEGHQDWIRKVVPSPCRKMLASCSNDQTIKVWAIEKFEIKYDLRDHEHVVEDVIWANYNSYQYIEAATSASNTNTNSNQNNINNNSSPTASTNGTSNHANANSSNSSIHSSNVNNGASSNGPVSGSKTTRYLVSASRDKSIKFWDINNSSVLFTLSGHDNWVRQLRFMPHGRFLLSCADDKSIKSWDIENRRCQRTINDAQEHFISCIDVTVKGHKVATGSVDTKIAVWSSR